MRFRSGVWPCTTVTSSGIDPEERPPDSEMAMFGLVLEQELRLDPGVNEERFAVTVEEHQLLYPGRDDLRQRRAISPA